MNAIWKWFNSDAGGISIIITILIALWTALRSLAKRRLELRLQEFKIYHELIRGLVAPDDKGKIWLDCQVGFVFELQHFPAHFDVSLRILRGLRATWGNNEEWRRLLDEMDATVAKICEKSKTKWHHVKQWFRDLSTY